jgi:mRNA-degrading endonuclease toxin of MazEF toxin-antitoxin module
MVDKIVSVPADAIGREIGRCDPLHLELIDDVLRRWLDL